MHRANSLFALGCLALSGCVNLQKASLPQRPANSGDLPAEVVDALAQSGMKSTATPKVIVAVIDDFPSQGEARKPKP